MTKKIVAFFILIQLSLIAQDTISKKDKFIANLDDHITTSINGNVIISRIRMKKSRNDTLFYADNPRLQAGYQYAVQYAKFKLSYNRLQEVAISDANMVTNKYSNYEFGYQYKKFNLDLGYTKFIYNNQTSSLNNQPTSNNIQYEQPYFDLSYLPRKCYFVNQINQANNIQKKSAWNISIGLNPYQRKYYTNSTLLLKDYFVLFNEFESIKNITQYGAVLKLKLDGNLVLGEVFYLALSIQSGLNKVYSTEQYHDGTKKKSSSLNAYDNWSWGLGFNFKNNLFLKFSMQQSRFENKLSSYSINDYSKSIKFSLGYRFKEPKPLKKLKKKIIKKGTGLKEKIL